MAGSVAVAQNGNDDVMGAVYQNMHRMNGFESRVSEQSSKAQGSQATTQRNERVDALLAESQDTAGQQPQMQQPVAPQNDQAERSGDELSTFRKKGELYKLLTEVELSDAEKQQLIRFLQQ